MPFDTYATGITKLADANHFPVLAFLENTSTDAPIVTCIFSTLSTVLYKKKLRESINTFTTSLEPVGKPQM